ncbi:3-keto-disaccharide hydrolase [Marinimicrobium locisalis]|uniref:3-keto-disaccharide hydrolase n=1 Tax=Marinimicrobium locisalis TaxID=546022 RepID=UPI003221ADE3
MQQPANLLTLKTLLSVTCGSLMALSCSADTPNETSGDALEPWQQAQKTEVWEPVPKKVEAPAGGAPSDAIVLFDGSDLSEWEGENGGEPTWILKDEAMTVARKKGGIRTKRSFCDVQLHLEWRTPKDIEGMDGQNRGNSGVFLQERYEVQVLDSYNNKTYPNGQAASIYKQHIPLVNASRPPGVWQSYDIIYQAPEFAEAGELETPAYVTVLHNGVVVQNHVEIQGTTEWIGEPSYDEAHGCAPLYLQDHDASVSYRNIWVREL